MTYKYNALEGKMDKVPEGGDLTYKFNPFTKKFDLVAKADSYSQIFNPVEGEFQLWNEGGSLLELLSLPANIFSNKIQDIQIVRMLGNAIMTNDNPTIENPSEIKMVGEQLVPTSYSVVEYIDFLGVGCFDTGFKPNYNTEIRMKFAPSNGTGNQYIYGNSVSTTGKQNFGAYLTLRGGGNWRFDGKTIALNISTSDDIYESIQNKDGIILNGENKGAYNGDEFTSTNTLNVGGNNDTSSTTFFQGRIYNLSIYDNGVLVRNYIPVLSGEAYGFYDTVNKTFNTVEGLTGGQVLSQGLCRIPVKITSNLFPTTLEYIYLGHPLCSIKGFTDELTSDGTVIRRVGYDEYATKNRVKHNTNAGFVSWKYAESSSSAETMQAKDRGEGWTYNEISTYYQFTGGKEDRVCNAIGGNMVTKYLVLPSSIATTAEEMNAWIRTKDYHLIYVLATEYNETATMPTLSVGKGTYQIDVLTSAKPKEVTLKGDIKSF